MWSLDEVLQWWVQYDEKAQRARGRFTPERARKAGAISARKRKPKMKGAKVAFVIVDEAQGLPAPEGASVDWRSRMARVNNPQPVKAPRG